MSGRYRKITAAQLKRLREWKPLCALAREMGMKPKTAQWARNYYFRTPCPEKRK